MLLIISNGVMSSFFVLQPKSSDPLIASAAADNTVRIWSVYNTQCLHTFSNETFTWNLSVGTCYSLAHGPVVIVGCKSSEVKVWGLPVDVSSKDYIKSAQELGLDLPAAISNSGREEDMKGGEGGREGRRRSHTGQEETSCRAEDTDSFRLVMTITGHPSRVTDLCVYHPDRYYNEHGEWPPVVLPPEERSETQEREQEPTRSHVDDKSFDRKKKRFSSGRISRMGQQPVVVTACRDLTLRLWR
jgi:WD40 repeat protein